MEEIKVSIIVPAYNVEPYVGECLDSLIAQTLREIEVVFVDDGSDDGTLAVAREYAQRDTRIKIYKQDHKGVAEARNRGLIMARGEYIGFVDSDDWITADAYARMYERARSCDADLVLGSILYCYGNEERRRYGLTNGIFTDENPLDGKSCLIRLLRSGQYIPMLCTNLYKRAFIERYPLSFECVYHEDEFFSPQALFYAVRVVDFREDFYYYRQRPQSIMHSDNLLVRADSLIHVSNTFFSFVGQHVSPSSAEVCFWILNRAIHLYMTAIQQYSRYCPDRRMLPPFDCCQLHRLCMHFSSAQILWLYSKYRLLLDELRRYAVS